MHHRRTVGLDIPCQVARLQSLTPLFQARRSLTASRTGTRPAEGNAVRLGSIFAQDPAEEAPGRTRRCAWGKDALKKSKKIPDGCESFTWVTFTRPPGA